MINCISEPLKEDLFWWVQNRVNTMGDVKKLHRGLLKEEFEVKKCPKCKMSFTDENCPTCGDIGLPEYTSTGKKMIRVKPMSKEGYEIWQEMCDEAIINYTTLGLEFDKCPNCKGGDGDSGTINCLPFEIKQDIVPYLRHKSKQYNDSGDGKLGTEAGRLADLFQNKVANCTNQGNPSYSWLKRRGFKKSDLVESGNILQVGKKTYKGLEL